MRPGTFTPRVFTKRAFMPRTFLVYGPVQRYTATGTPEGLGVESNKGIAADGVLHDGATTSTITPTATANVQFGAESPNGLVADGTLYDGATTSTITPTATAIKVEVEAE